MGPGHRAAAQVGRLSDLDTAPGWCETNLGATLRRQVERA
jgi:hypothetical protein